MFGIKIESSIPGKRKANHNEYNGLHKVHDVKFTYYGVIVTENEIAHNIVGAALEVHRQLGPGLLESVYQECLAVKLEQHGLLVEKEKCQPVVFENILLDYGYRIDLLVENKVVVEIKSVTALQDLHLSQILTYMKLGEYKLGLLINFNVLLLKQGIKRVINGSLND